MESIIFMSCNRILSTVAFCCCCCCYLYILVILNCGCGLNIASRWKLLFPNQSIWCHKLFIRCVVAVALDVDQIGNNPFISMPKRHSKYPSLLCNLNLLMNCKCLFARSSTPKTHILCGCVVRQSMKMKESIERQKQKPVSLEFSTNKRMSHCQPRVVACKQIFANIFAIRIQLIYSFGCT